jgi:hypothetical protein
MATRIDDPQTRIERRHKIAELLLVVFLAVAFEEMAGPVLESIKRDGIHWETVLLFSIFFFTSIRFFIGCQLHLLNEELLRNGGMWFYDLMWIISEMTLLIFLGGVSTVEASRSSHVGFVKILVVLYLFDVVWIVSQLALGAIIPGWNRKRTASKTDWRAKFFPSWQISQVPWEWAVLNTVLLAGMFILHQFVPDVYSLPSLIGLATLNVAGFVIDIIFTDFTDFM